MSAMFLLPRRSARSVSRMTPAPKSMENAARILPSNKHPANGPRDKVVGAVMADDQRIDVHLERAGEGRDVHEQDAQEVDEIDAIE